MITICNFWELDLDDHPQQLSCAPEIMVLPRLMLVTLRNGQRPGLVNQFEQWLVASNVLKE